MTTNNFQLLQARWPQLYEYAKFAEKYVHGDPHTSIMKLRCFAEQLVGILFRELDLPYDRNDSFFDKLTSNVFLEVVDESILQKLHAIRMLGNKAAHGKNASPKDALSLLYDAYLIGQWLFKTYSGSFDELYPAFTEPTPPSGDGDKMHDKNEKLEKQLEAVKAELALLQGYEQEAHNEKFKLQKTLDEAKIKHSRMLHPTRPRHSISVLDKHVNI